MGYESPNSKIGQKFQSCLQDEYLNIFIEYCSL